MSDGTPQMAGGTRGSVTKGESDSLYGGAALFVLAVVALGISFYHPGPAGFFGPVLWPRVFSLLIALGGLGLVTGQLRARNPQDFYGGVALIGLALVAMLASIDLPGMRGFAFGPGTAPRLFANMLAGLGLVLAITGLLADGPEGQRYSIPGLIIVVATFAIWGVLTWIFNFITPFYAQVIATMAIVVATVFNLETLERYGLRSMYTIVLSVFSFAVNIRPLGLIIASFLAILVCAGAATDIRWRETVIWGILLTAFCAVLFPYGLNLPFQLWPRF